jgi:two-component system chemotaxis response regulator CheY
MEKLYIICVEDQREVLNTIVEQLSLFEELIVIEECESAHEAMELIETIDEQGDHIAIVISDHVMPGQSGVDFLVALKEDFRFEQTKKILITGQATHHDTIQAINQAAIDFYIEKPWNMDDLVGNVKTLLTVFIIEKGIDYNPYLSLLDKPKLFELLK